MASDDNYAQPLGVSVYSMLDNFLSEKYKIKIIILDGGIIEKNKIKLEKICNNFETEVTFIKIPDNEFKNFPIMAHFSKAIYYRLLIPNIITEEVEKAIYLDCDILVLGNITELYETDIENFYVGAVKDFISDKQILKSNISFYKHIKKMFNSGVLLMNLKKMRKDNFIQQSIDFINRHSKELLLPDQDALNFLCINNWTEVDKKWNYQMDRSQERVHPTPNILHYTASYKPWHSFYNNYYQKYYKRYLKKAWPNYKIKPVSFNVAIKQIIKHIPFSIFIVRKTRSLLRTINY